MTQYGICRICKTPIWNGIPKEEMERSSFSHMDYMEKMEKAGYTLGYFNSPGYSLSSDSTRRPYPICSKCSNKAYEAKKQKKMELYLQKIEIPKKYSCPVCEHDALVGHGRRIFKSNTQKEVKEHMKTEHDLSSIESIYRHQTGSYK